MITALAILAGASACMWAVVLVAKVNVRQVVADARAAVKDPRTPARHRRMVGLAVVMLAVPIPGPVDELIAGLLLGRVVRAYRRRLSTVATTPTTTTPLGVARLADASSTLTKDNA